MLEFTCPSCGKQMQADNAFAAKQVLCPGCNATVTAIPANSSAFTATSTHAKSSEGAFSEGLPPMPPAMPNLRKAPVLGGWLPYLIVAGIAVTAIGLMIPVIQRWREASARTQSIDHLKKIVLGFQGFHDVNKRLPFNGTGPAKANDNTSGSWAFQILPFVDQAPLFVRPNTTTAVAVYMCPGRGRPMVSTTGAWSDYCINPWLNDRNGVVNAPDIRRTMVGIIDGTSNTIFVGHGNIDPDLYSSTVPLAHSTDIFKGGNAASARNSTTNQQDMVGNAGRTWGGPFPQGALMGMGDGTVRTFPYTCTGGNIRDGWTGDFRRFPRDGGPPRGPLAGWLMPCGGLDSGAPDT